MIAYDNSTSGKNTALDSLTISGFAVGSGSNRFLFVGVSWGTGTGVTLSSVTFNGDSLTRLSSSLITNSTLNAEIFYMVNPDNATGDIVVTMSGATRVTVAGAIALTGVDQTTPTGAKTTASNTGQTSIATNLTTTYTNSWILDVLGTAKTGSSNPVTAQGTQSERWDLTDTYLTSVYGGAGSYESETTIGSKDMGWNSSFLTNHVHSLVEIVEYKPTITFTGDGLIQETKTKTFTGDGIVLATQTKTFTSDGIIATRNTNTFTSDGLIKDTFTKTFTADGIMKAVTTKTFTADGVIIAQVQLTFTADLIIDLGPYRYRLGSQILPRPNKMYRENVYKRVEYDCLDGSTKRDLTNVKEEIVLEYDYLGEDTMAQILLEIDTNTPVLFEVAEENFVINQTLVIPLVIKRDYQKGGAYYQSIQVRLTEKQ